MLPSYIDHTHFQYVQVENQFVATLLVKEYPRETTFLSVLDSIPKDVCYDLCMWVEKQDTTQVLKKLTYCISSTGTEMKTIHENQRDIDILGTVKEDAKELRRQIQIHNEEIFFVHLFFTFYADSFQTLWKKIKDFQSKIYARQLVSTITNFRHLNYYLFSLPIGKQKHTFIEKGYRNMTTSALCNFFPFYTKTIFDKKGILFGYTKLENKICSIDIFDEKYLNANMCILGSSGSGKSYFTKIMLIRHFLKGKRQFVFDPEEEYVDIVDKLQGNCIYLGNQCGKQYWNLLDIANWELEDDFLTQKIKRTVYVLSKLMGGLEKKEEEALAVAMRQSYVDKGITNEKESLLQHSKKEQIYLEKKWKEKEDFPTLADVVKQVKLKRLEKKLQQIITEHPNIARTTNFEHNMLCCFCLKGLSYEKANAWIAYYLKYLQQDAKQEKKRHTILYLDEIWKYITIKSEHSLAEVIFSLFKTIRKNRASIVAITQDISDFFSIENGNYGKSIMNNSGFKMIFKLAYQDHSVLEQCGFLGEEYHKEMAALDKGQAILSFKQDKICIQIKSNAYEDNLIEGGNHEDISSIR